MTAPSDARHPAWCDPARCTVAAGGAHNSAVRDLGYDAFTEQQVWAAVWQKPGRDPLVEVLVCVRRPADLPDEQWDPHGHTLSLSQAEGLRGALGDLLGAVATNRVSPSRRSPGQVWADLVALDAEPLPAVPAADVPNAEKTARVAAYWSAVRARDRRRVSLLGELYRAARESGAPEWVTGVVLQALTDASLVKWQGRQP